MTLSYNIGDGYSALDAQAWRDTLDGFAIVSGLTPSDGASGLEVDIASGTATVGETSGSVDTVTLGSATTVTLNAADSTNPRKDTIYIDTNGAIQVEPGTAEAADPSGNTRFQTFQPEPPFPSTTGTILAEVWVAAGATTLSSADIRDRRVPADVVLDRVVAQSVTTDNLALGSVTGDGILAQAIEHGKVWADDGKLYDNIQTAENNASSFILVGPGTFSENITVDTSKITIVGSGLSTVIDGGTGGEALDITANDVTIRNLAAKTTSGGGTASDPFNVNADGVRITSVWVTESDNRGIVLNSNHIDCMFTIIKCTSSAIDGDDILLSGDDSLVDDVEGSVTDNGTGNTVGETA